MPVQLKRKKMKPYDIRFRKIALVMLGMTLVFTVVFGILVQKIFLGVKWAVILNFVLFCLYFLSVVVTAVTGIWAYVKEDNVPDLIQGIVLLATVVSCLLNAKTAVLMLFVIANNEKVVGKLLGDYTYFQYVSTQYSHWIFLLIGIVIAMIIGVLSVVTLMKNKK